VWRLTAPCEHKFCADSKTCGECPTAPCAAGEVKCADGVAQSCVVDSSGCLAWDAGSKCPEGVSASATACGKCDATCLAARAPRLTAGAQHACLIGVDGTLQCWGLGTAVGDCIAKGECGQAKPPAGTFKRVSAGKWNTCALTPTSAGVCWGLPDGARNAVPAGALNSIAEGNFYGCAVRATGDLVCWGSEFTNKVPTGNDFTQVATGEHHSCALRSSGKIACWAYQAVVFSADSSRVVPPSGTFTQLSTGWRHNCAIATDGTLACWGKGDTAPTASSCTTMGTCGQSLPPTGTYEKVTAGYYHSCAIRSSDHKPVCWGKSTFANPPDLEMIEIAAGEDFTCGVLTDGGVVCWPEAGGSSLALTNPGCTSTSCTEANKGVCVGYADGTHTCKCNSGFIDVGGSCVDATPCDPNPCTTSHTTICTDVDHKAVCSCDAGYAADSTGACRTTTPCSPNPCTTVHQTTCTPSGFDYTCSCDSGYAPDSTGTCRWATPCSPNPCTTGHRTTCTASGFDYTCSCESGYVDSSGTCVFVCPSGSHTDGDSHEPNECAGQATTLPLTTAGNTVATTTANIGPLTSDVDFFRFPRVANHQYWTLLNASTAMCNGGFTGWDLSVPMTGSWTYGNVLTGTTDLVFSCATPSNLAYSLGVLDFDLTKGDYPSATFTSLGSARAMWDTMTSSDTDKFSFIATPPLTIYHVGAAANVTVSGYNAATGAKLADNFGNCGTSVTNKACIGFTGFGSVRFDVTVTYSYDTYSPDSTFNAYGLTW
jgi:alpha-tubulin suppressor-like RCC1 family protein